ncbi:MAG: hypothetical protein AAF585_19320, partial [Verrucomicrobiota bacterium]
MNSKSILFLMSINLVALTLIVPIATAGEITYYGRAHEQFQGQHPGDVIGSKTDLKLAGAICTWLERNDYTSLEVSQ